VFLIMNVGPIPLFLILYQALFLTFGEYCLIDMK